MPASSPTITILGLGPGRFDDLTLSARTLLEQAARNKQTVYFRTLIHPTVEPLQEAIPNLHIESVDALYDESADWDTLYQQISDKICALAARDAVKHAVGHGRAGAWQAPATHDVVDVGGSDDGDLGSGRHRPGC